MGQSAASGPLSRWYERRIGEARTADEVQGYWLFVMGVLAAIIGVIVFSVTEATTMARGIGYAVAGLAPVFVTLGAVVRFPLRHLGTRLAYLGAVIAVLGVLWFLVVFPAGWSTETGHLGVIVVYSVGVVVIGLAGAFVPLMTDPIQEDYERLQAEAAETESDLQASEVARRESDAVAADHAARVTSLTAELADIQSSKARFELYEDAEDTWRWRLRHRNGNVIADGGQGFSSKQKCQQGLGSVRRNALAAGMLELTKEEPDDVEEPRTAIIEPSEEPTSSATFELFKDAEAGWRWRLRHDNGNVIADSGEGYASRSNLDRAVSRIREHMAAGSYLEIDPVAFEIYLDTASEYRWRLLHKNGNILADSGQGYSSRSNARRAVERVRTSLPDAEVSEQ